MRNFDASDSLMREAEKHLEEMSDAYRKGWWNIVVRRAQEVVELSLKALLKMMGIEYPKEHDVGGVLELALKQKRIDIDPESLVSITTVSSDLARERAPAFYMERVYSEQQALEAKESAQRIRRLARELAEKLRKEGEPGQ